MLVSRYALQSYPTLKGNNNQNYFRTRDERNEYYSGTSISVGFCCAIGGDPESPDWSEVVWEVDQYDGANWATIDLSQNFALIVTNEGITALSDASTGQYKFEISRILVKSTQAPLGTNLSSWNLNQFLTVNGYSDICLDTNNAQNSTFTLENNLSYRTNLLNGGIQFTLHLGLDCLGQFTSQEGSINPTLTDFDISMIGLCIKDQREDTNGNDILFAIANLSAVVHKIASTPTRVGNDLKLYLNTTLSNFGNVANLECIRSEVGSVPEVTDEDELADTYDGENSPYNLYIVDNLAGTNVPAIAIRKGNPVSPTNPISWSYLMPNDDTLALHDDSLIDPSLKNYMVTAWDGNKYIPADPKTNNTLAGLYVNKNIIYAGKVTNSNAYYNYSFTYDKTAAVGYKTGDTVSCLVSDILDPTRDTRFMFQISRASVYNEVTHEGGKPLEILVSPTYGNYKSSTNNQYVDTQYYGSQIGTGTGLKVKVDAIDNDSVTWNFPSSWIDKPLYLDYDHTNDPNWDTYKQILPVEEQGNDKKDRRGKLTVQPSGQSSYQVFIGWCLSEKSIKLALDLRNEATTVVYGTTRYATEDEIKNADPNAAVITSVSPDNLFKYYLKKEVSGNTGSSTIAGDERSKPQIVNTYTKFTKSIECTGNDLNGVAFYGTAYRAMWADLAEFYHSDKMYPAGTLICIGAGLNEITEATIECNGIISTKPGYELGEKKSELDLPVALIGKVPVLFDGECVPKFGDRVYLSKNMPGRASTIPNGKCLGKIIDKRKNLDQINSIMCSVRIDF